MSRGRLSALAEGLWHLHRTPDMAAMRAARSPDELARLAVVPAARNLSIAAGVLPADQRSEATAALLACRVLDAYKNLTDRPLAACAVLTAADYLNGDTDTSPQPIRAIAGCDSEAVDLVLAERIRDVRDLLSELPFEGRRRVGRLLADVGRVMALNLDRPLPRTAYGEGVLGRVMLYVCSLVAEDACAEADLSEFAGCVGVTVQLANDLRDGELVLYSASDREELTRAIMQRMPAPALGSIALLARLGPCINSRGARVAMAYTTIKTTAFLCAAVGAPAPYRRPVRLAAAVLASVSTAHWNTMLKRVRCSVDGAIHRLLDASPHPPVMASSAARSVSADLLALGDPRSMPPSVGPLIVGATFALVEALPGEPLTGELPDFQVRRMMIADHLAFGALERLRPCDADALRALATQFQLAALAPLSRQATPEHNFDSA
ncbi:hypothetical protein [Mycolicibacterium arseniciresistens]|uniref:Uncharacterized protein n=1 Tax=Mycolicibacterium arseniciresistens TaxID=3062257 RepID=A0ABT8UEC1_9MYCO|nr:hypothetical protein [Mycolicibacterium arseniciresistens]MDO3635215.1 hypothetical protein [Mycolicibacterium arseniciresistens]